MAKTNFENLRVYRLAEELADEAWRIVSAWKMLPQDTVGKQLVRAADSIGANIAEGSGRGTNEEYRRFLRIARGSLYETKHWLRRAFRRGLLDSKQTESLKDLVDNLVPALNAFLRSVGKNCSQPKKQPPRTKT